MMIEAHTGLLRRGAEAAVQRASYMDRQRTRVEGSSRRKTATIAAYLTNAREFTTPMR